MKDELWRRKRLNGYAIATGHEYTWQDVNALVDIAELAIDQYIRRTFNLGVCLELDRNWVGKDRSWVEYEAECQVWTAVAPNNLNYPKKEQKLPFWWSYLREEVKAELQTVMNRTGSTWGYDEDGRVSYVTFVHPLLHVSRGGRGELANVMSGQSIPGGWGSTTTSPSGWNTTRPAPSTAAAQSSTFPTFNDDPPLYGAIFSKHIIPVILLPSGKQEYIAPVEKKFMCKIRGTQARESFKLWAEPWQRGGPVDAGVIACGIFINSYEREVRYYFSKDTDGPRIDNFLDFYIGDDFTTVEQRTSADFEYLNRRDLRFVSATPPAARN